MSVATELIPDPVFLELATSEPNGAGRIVRVSAQRGEGADAKRYESLVRSERLTLAQCRLAGVTNAALDSAPDTDSVLDQLLEFSLGAGAWIVAQGPATRTALREAFTTCGLVGNAGPTVVGIDELKSLAPDNRSGGVPPPVAPSISEDVDEFEAHYGKHLPHWRRKGASYFVTFRLADSVPAPVLQEWREERQALKRRKADKINPITSEEESKLSYLLSAKINAYLDNGAGACLLANKDVAEIVQSALKHFHSERYDLLAWAVMPNHVHVVVAPVKDHKLEDILHSWKSYTSKEIAKVIGRDGAIWQEEYYDHLIRDEDDFRRIFQYVLQNPVKARLENWIWVGENLSTSDTRSATRSDGGRDAPTTIISEYESAISALLALPLPLVAEMNWLLAKSEHPLKKFLKKVVGLQVKERFDEVLSQGKLAFEKLFRDYSPIIDRLKPEEDTGDLAIEHERAEPLSPQEVEDLLGANGPLAKGLEGYEDRPEQIAMARRVAEAFDVGRHLLVEAGTGVGKSLAYLVPAILFARKAKRPVIISTHTKNLQSQLYQKDVPFLKKHLGVDFEASVLKGRPNYLCLRKFMFTLQEGSGELDETERAQMLPIMSWATRTDSGDINDLDSFAPEQNYALWDRLHTVGDDCLKRHCPFYKRCFVYKARGEARGADLVITNHALVFSDLNVESGSLPPTGEIVFDEAHKLEDVATDHLASEITPRRVYKILNRLFRTAQGQTAGRGLLPTLLGNIEMARGEFQSEMADGMRERMLRAIQAVAPAAEGADYFFQTLRDWTEQPATAPGDDEPAQPFVPRERGRDGWMPQGGAGGTRAPNFKAPFGAKKNFNRSDDRKRYNATNLQPPELESFNSAKEAAISRLGMLRQALEKLEDDFKEIRKKGIPRSRELTTEIGAQGLFLQELIHDIEFIVKGDEPNYVYWGERFGKKASRMVAAPLDVAALLYSQLYQKRRALIFASATLSLRDVDADAGSGMAPIRNRGMSESPLRTTAPAEDVEPALAKPHKKSFEYVKQRLGLSLCEAGRLDELLLGSPFDYSTQCKLLVPTFLPEPGGMREKDFTEKFSQMIAELAIAAGGRTLVLYTSYAALDASAKALRKTLAPENIEVLAQGQDGSRESLLARLKEGGRSVLLGTASFWEGVDVRGQALSLLIIAKLPFAVFTDPIVQGRCELLEAAGKDAFLHYSIPNAILKLRQGFGRLIRSKEDRGIVVLADKRVITKRYGAAFLRALPSKASTITDPSQLSDVVRNTLEKSGE